MVSDLQVVDRLVERIINLVHPLKIILFGSYATGEQLADSDIDVLVVMPEGVHRRATAQFLYRKIRGIGVPFDIIVATTEDLKKYRDNIGLIYRDILNKGREVYVA